MKKIRKVLCVAVAMLLCGLGAQAQFRAGIRAGVTINKLHLSDLGANFNSDNRCGFTGGVMAEFTIPVVGICFDASLMYSRMNSQVDGYYYNDESGALRNDFENSAKDFLQIPINIKYKIGLPVVGKIITPYIYTGPDFAFRLGSSDCFKRFQAAWDLGIGVELLRHLQVGAGYSWGMNNVAKKIWDGDKIADFKTHNNYWTITAAYLF